MNPPMSGWESALAIAGLAVVTLCSRSFFLYPEREPQLPAWVRRGLRYAPLAALAAVVAPEIVMEQGRLIDDWRDARLFAAAAAGGYWFWRRGLLGTIVTGMAVLVPLKLYAGW